MPRLTRSGLEERLRRHCDRNGSESGKKFCRRRFELPLVWSGNDDVQGGELEMSLRSIRWQIIVAGRRRDT
jgi:hypothetical protein